MCLVMRRKKDATWRMFWKHHAIFNDVSIAAAQNFIMIKWLLARGVAQRSSASTAGFDVAGSRKIILFAFSNMINYDFAANFFDEIMTQEKERGGLSFCRCEFIRFRNEWCDVWLFCPRNFAFILLIFHHDLFSAFIAGQFLLFLMDL